LRITVFDSAALYARQSHPLLRIDKAIFKQSTTLAAEPWREYTHRMVSLVAMTAMLNALLAYMT
jgi:heme A synthase